MNLIICKTPLQMFLAERIICDCHLENNFLILITFARNDDSKYQYYYKRLGSHCDYSHHFIVDVSNFFTKFFTLFKLLVLVIKLNKKKINSCYVSNIDSPYVQFITSCLSYDQLFTFDDGSANIMRDSFFFKDESYSKKHIALRYLLGIGDNVKKYRENSVLHFTMFEGHNNITDSTQHVPLFRYEKIIDYSCRNDSLRIFLGQPLHEINLSPEDIIRLFNTEKIDYYFPHPRETDRIADIKYLESEKIIEDYVSDTLRIGKFNKIYIFTFFSTGALNLCSLPSIEVISYRSERIPEQYAGVYEIFSSLGINVKNLDSECNSHPKKSS